MPLLFIAILSIAVGSLIGLTKTIDLKIPILKLPPITLPKNTPIFTTTPEIAPENQDKEISKYDFDLPLIETTTPTTTPTPTPKPIKKVTKPQPTLVLSPSPKYNLPTFKAIPTVNLDQIRQQQEKWWQDSLKRQEEFKRQSEEKLEKFRQESEQKMLEFKQRHGF
jgi:hypothetical protein